MLRSSKCWWLWKEPVVVCGNWDVRQAASQQVFKVAAFCVDTWFQSFSPLIYRIAHHALLKFSPCNNRPLAHLVRIASISCLCQIFAELNIPKIIKIGWFLTELFKSRQKGGRFWSTNSAPRLRSRCELPIVPKSLTILKSTRQWQRAASATGHVTHFPARGHRVASYWSRADFALSLMTSFPAIWRKSRPPKHTRRVATFRLASPIRLNFTRSDTDTFAENSFARFVRRRKFYFVRLYLHVVSDVFVCILNCVVKRGKGSPYAIA